MCIAFWGRFPWGFFLAFNRDEYILRPSSQANFWQDYPHILAGRDLIANGTWLGVSVKSGRIAFVTNLRAKGSPPDEVQPQQYLSRGQLVTNFLDSTLSPETYIKSIDASKYHGFNLVCVDFANNAMAYSHNLSTLPGHEAQDEVQKASCGARPGGQCLCNVVPLDAGKMYGLSNGLLNEWPKVKGGIDLAKSLLSTYEELCYRKPGDLRQALPWEALFSDLLGDSRRDESLTPKHLLVQQQQQQQQQDSGAPSQASPSTRASEPAAPPASEGPQGSASKVAESLPPPQTKGSVAEEAASGGTAHTQSMSVEQLNADDHLEFVASARFIAPVPSKFGPYGTRSQTVLALWEDGTGELRERSLQLQAEGMDPLWQEEKHTFALEF